jgi:hypothetical protein
MDGLRFPGKAVKKLFRANPPWTDKILTKHWDAIQRQFGEKNMPLTRTEHPKDIFADIIETEKKIVRTHKAIDDATLEYRDSLLEELHGLKSHLEKQKKRSARKPRGYQEFGCGRYGCVMPTGTPGTVFKVTTDATEAAFVAAYLAWPDFARPQGIVRYHKLLSIKGERHSKRPVFILLRDEALSVGKKAIETWIAESSKKADRSRYAESMRQVVFILSAAVEAAHIIRTLVSRKPDAYALLDEGKRRWRAAGEISDRVMRGRDTALKIAYQFQQFEEKTALLEQEPMGIELGRALHQCFHKHGLLLADVHANNIGMPGTSALRDAIGDTPIITDPGHALALDARYKGVTVEEI